MQPYFLHYIQNRLLYPATITAPPCADLDLIVVIPSRNEPHLCATLTSLQNASRSAPVEVIVVINGAQEDPPELRQRNHFYAQEAEAWAKANPSADFFCHILYFPDLPSRHAGVGLARKIGMDEALIRFHRLQNPQGVIVCLDADCTVAPNYFDTLQHHFRHNPDTPGCAIYFEHPFANLTEERHRQAIVLYELYLRYWRAGLHFCGFPYPFHTIGSSMAVRANAYSRQGGMNQRKAGEDFYFLQKILPLGQFTEVNTTTVYPSPRVSWRVPFGTGRAVKDWLEEGRPDRLVANPQGWLDLFFLFSSIEQLYSERDDFPPLSPALEKFLGSVQWSAALNEIRQNSASPATFRARFFQWFNAFRIRKFFNTPHPDLPLIPIEQASATLLHWWGLGDLEEQDREKQLDSYRQLDKQGWPTPPSQKT
ncbi:MAG: glycosyltransferase family 2 protein [Magnetococcus sp. DMHC-6]